MVSPSGLGSPKRWPARKGTRRRRQADRRQGDALRSQQPRPAVCGCMALDLTYAHGWLIAKVANALLQRRELDGDEFLDLIGAAGS